MKIGAVMFFTTDSMRPAPLARALEERGFESLWVPEHTHIPSSRKSEYPSGGALIRPRPRTKVAPAATNRSTATWSSQSSVASSLIRVATGVQSGTSVAVPALCGRHFALLQDPLALTPAVPRVLPGRTP